MNAAIKTAPQKAAKVTMNAGIIHIGRNTIHHDKGTPKDLSNIKGRHNKNKGNVKL